MNEYRFTCQECWEEIVSEAGDVDDAREQAEVNHRTWDDCEGELA